MNFFRRRSANKCEKMHTQNEESGQTAAEDKKRPGKSAKVRRLLIKHAVFIALFALCLLLLNISGIHCPIRYITGIPCPGCGTTRALLALCRLDFGAVLYYNPAAPFIAALLLFALHHRVINPSETVSAFFYGGCAAVILGTYAVRAALGLLV